jgi:hypothetical protein
VLAFDAVDESLGTFNTIVLFGNNFGLFGTPTKAKQLLRRLHRITSNDARIIVESRDVERRGGADAPWHRRYRERNIARGRLPGQIRIRVRFRDVIGPWMDYPMVSPDHLREILAGTRWYRAHLFRLRRHRCRDSRRAAVEMRRASALSRVRVGVAMTGTITRVLPGGAGGYERGCDSPVLASL